MIENAEKMEKILELMGDSFIDYFRKGDYVEAKRMYQAMRGITTGAKLRLVGLMMRSAGVAGGAAGKAQREMIEKQAVKLTEETLAKIAYQQRTEAIVKAFGFVAKRFLGPLGIALLIKDVSQGGLAIADSFGQQMILNRIALYDDYLEENERSSQTALIKTYPEWLATDYLPEQQRKNSEFFKNMRMVFPHPVPVWS